MAKSKVKPRWVGPLKQFPDGKKPWGCEYGHPITGEKKRQRLGPATMKVKDREEAYYKFKKDITDGYAPGKKTMNDAFDEFERWMEQRNELKMKCSGTRLTLLRSIMRNHLRPDLGNVLATKLTTPMIEDWICEKAKTLDSWDTLYQFLSQTLDRIAYLDWIDGSPLARKKPQALPPKKEANIRIPTIEEGRALWFHLEQEGNDHRKIPYHDWTNRMAAIACAMFGGVCRGELGGLLWENIDFANCVIRIKHGYSLEDKLGPPKTKHRLRTIPMAPPMYKWLGTIHGRDAHPSTGHAFLSEEGAVLCKAIYGSLRYAQTRHGFVDDNGKPLFSLHSLRHYAGSLWLEAGMKMEDVSRLLGHGSLRTTQKYYIHYFEKQHIERDRAALERATAMMVPATRALPSPVRDSCEIDGQAIEIED